MKKLWKRGSALLLALALSLAAPAGAAESVDSEAAPSLEETALAAAQAAQTYGGADSIQYAVWQEGGIVLSGSSGAYSRTENRALTADILYGIGSVSKIYTTVAVMQLAEADRLSLDAPVTRYLQNFKMADERYTKITVRMLLNHSSGLMGSHMENAMLFDDTDCVAADRLLEQLASQRLKADPGAYSVYCNDGFTLAELVVEAVTGMDFMDYVRSHILEPAGLTDTYAPGDDFDTGRLAKTYRGTDDRALPQDCLNLAGAGGIYATAGDLAAFGGALSGTELLQQTSLDAMAAPEYARGIWPETDAPGALSYGLGWDCVEWLPFSQSGIQALVKGGDTLRYHAGLVVLPEYRMAAAVLSSGGASTYNEMAAAQVLAAVLKEQGVETDESLPLLPEASPAPMPAALLENAGYYGATSAQYQVELSADGTLSMRILTMPSIPAQTFTYREDGTFRDLLTGQAALKFVKEENGQTYLYQQAVSFLPGLGALPVASYAAVKLPENPLSPADQAAWDRYLSLSFLPMGEKYSSQTYLALADSTAAETPELAPGYAGCSRIVDSTSARYELQIPGSDGRDGQDIDIYEQDGATWMAVNGAVYMAAEGARALYTGAGSYSTVQENGYARWYQVGGNAGKTMTVQVPENAGFWVYDGSGQVTASSVLWGDTTAALPQDGFVVFAGDPGTRFYLSFS